MFTIKSEGQNSISKLILSESALGIFGVTLLVIMLFFAFAETASESNPQQSAKAKQSKPTPSGLVAKNMKSVR